jgi:hypothetical protein
VRLAVSQKTVPAFIRAQPADEMFALAEAVADSDRDRAEFEAALHGTQLSN